MAAINWSATEIAAALVETPPVDVVPEDFSGKREEFKIYPEWGTVKTRFVQEIVSRIKGPVAYVEFAKNGMKTVPIPIVDALGPRMVGSGRDDDGDAAYIADLISTVLSEDGAQVMFFGSDRRVKKLEVSCRVVRKDVLGDGSDVEVVSGVHPMTTVIERMEIRHEF